MCYPRAALNDMRPTLNQTAHIAKDKWKYYPCLSRSLRSFQASQRQAYKTTLAHLRNLEHRASLVQNDISRENYLH